MVAVDRYQVDPGTSSGAASRWTNGYGGPFGYRDLRSNDARGLTFTSAPLAKDLEIIGHPVADLWVSSDQPDAALFVYLEDVHPGGYSQYVTEGALRLSHREEQRPRGYLDLPYHRGDAADVRPLPPGESRGCALTCFLPRTCLGPVIGFGWL